MQNGKKTNHRADTQREGEIQPGIADTERCGRHMRAGAHHACGAGEDDHEERQRGELDEDAQDPAGRQPDPAQKHVDRRYGDGATRRRRSPASPSRRATRRRSPRDQGNRNIRST